MVTFSLPGDGDVASEVNGTPRARPLPFAKRAYAASPFAPSSSKRFGTPHTSSTRKMLTTRDEIPSSSLNNNQIATARNIFRASTISDTPPRPTSGPFSPSIPPSTMKRVFAPGATPEPSRVYRGSTAQATPRGVAAKASEKELFPMRISSPPSELTGEVLAEQVPKDWNSKGSIYADQFLAHLCPPELDEEQRRQFFCILDLRRLKYAANEIFAKKDWKLNVINFGKEFEKSRSIILLRYGLYEFQNVKPSKEVLKRWRREHGLPEPEAEENETPVSTSTPSKTPASKKRKADGELNKAVSGAEVDVNGGKRRATEKAPEPERIVSTSNVLGKNKRRASNDEEDEPQPSKRSTPSAAKSLFEKIANKSTTAPLPALEPETTKAALATPEDSAAKPNLFNKPTSGGLARSVFTNIKNGPSQNTTSVGSNIFGYLSDASSAKNSGVDADAESDSDSDDQDSPEAGQSDVLSGAAVVSGAESDSRAGSALFANKGQIPSGLDTAASSAPGTRESTPGRSLFERVTKGNDGEPIRTADAAREGPVEEKPAPADQTWNPTTTPLKFAPTSQAGSVFGKQNPGSTATSIFPPKPTTSTTNLFGAQNDNTSSKDTSVSAQTEKDGGESDKENESRVSKKQFEPKPSTNSSTQPAFGSLFQPKSLASVSSASTAEPAQSNTNLFGSSAKPSTSTLFGAAKPSAAPAPPTQTSSLFGVKTAAPELAAKPEASNASQSIVPASGSAISAAAPSLFASKPAGNASSLFGGSSQAPEQSLFGSAAPPAQKKDVPAAAPTFSFGSASKGTAGTATQPAASKPLFGAPKSPPPGTSVGKLFDGSPMKQDEQSPAKRMFTGNDAASSVAPKFSFGGPNPAATTSFGGPSSNGSSGSNTPSVSFGGNPASNGASSSFGFNFGGGPSAETSFNNPFSSGNNGGTANAAPSSGGMFSFSGANSATSSKPASPFQFGNGGANTPTSGPPMFGNNPSANNSSFDGSVSTSGSAPIFNFTSAPTQGGNVSFGANQAAPAFGNLQPPNGGSSTTGTNSPFNLGGGSSLATTPAAGTPEPSAKTNGATDADDEEGEKHEQINLTDGAEADEDTVHEVRAKVLKFTPDEGKSEESDGDLKSKSPWSTQGVGPLRLLKHKETNSVRLLLRAEPRGHIAINRALLPDLAYKADEKYVRLTTSNEQGDGLETWMIQVKTKDLAKELAKALEENKIHNKS